MATDSIFVEVYPQGSYVVGDLIQIAATRASILTSIVEVPCHYDDDGSCLGFWMPLRVHNTLHNWKKITW